MNLRVIDSGASAQGQEEDSIGREISAAVLAVHAAIGPGLPEGIYERCLEEELKSRGMIVDAQVPVAIVYGAKKISNAFSIDLLVQGSVIVEIKTVEALTLFHEAQLQTYLKHADVDAGYLVNFHALSIKDGVKRLVRRKQS
jgi:GxxExxY protein